jgi:hypothetical protein
MTPILALYCICWRQHHLAVGETQMVNVKGMLMRSFSIVHFLSMQRIMTLGAIFGMCTRTCNNHLCITLNCWLSMSYSILWLETHLCHKLQNCSHRPLVIYWVLAWQAKIFKKPATPLDYSLEAYTRLGLHRSDWQYQSPSYK